MHEFLDVVGLVRAQRVGAAIAQAAAFVGPEQAVDIAHLLMHETHERQMHGAHALALAAFDAAVSHVECAGQTVEASLVDAVFLALPADALLPVSMLKRIASSVSSDTPPLCTLSRNTFMKRSPSRTVTAPCAIA